MTGRRLIARFVGLIGIVVSCAAAATQTPGTPAPVVTEARRREILQAAAALTSETFADVLRRAEAGDAEAQHDLAIAYVNGQGVRKDRVEAERWFKASSEQGFAEASFLYGLVNFEKAPPGRTDPLGTRVGVSSWQLSAEQGYPVAAAALGDLYTGRVFRYHVTRDDFEACTWYVIASHLDKLRDWGMGQPAAVAAMRKDLPGRIDKVRKSLGVTQYAQCERGASDWMTAHPQRRQE